MELVSLSAAFCENRWSSGSHCPRAVSFHGLSTLLPVKYYSQLSLASLFTFKTFYICRALPFYMMGKSYSNFNLVSMKSLNMLIYFCFFLIFFLPSSLYIGAKFECCCRMLVSTCKGVAILCEMNSLLVHFGIWITLSGHLHWVGS